MKVEKAYSRTLKRNVTVSTINHEINHDNLVIDKNDFVCPSCKQSITCVNMGKYKHLGQCKRETHFRLNGSHKLNCDIVNSDVRHVEYEISDPNHTVKPSGAFKLDLGDNGFDIPKPATKSSNQVDGSFQNSQTQHVSHGQKSESSSINRLEKLISMFHSPDYDNDSKNITYGDNILSLNDIFFNVDKAQEVSEHHHVYYGKASIRERIIDGETSPFYVIEFTSSLSFDETDIKNQMSLIIYKDKIQNTHHLQKLLNHLDNDFTIYVYGKPFISKNTFINIDYYKFNPYNISILD